MQRAWRLQWTWMLGLASIVIAVYFTLGNSQAMKTAWIEDLLSFVPPIAFMTASWIERWEAHPRFPLGYIRITSIAYLVSADALAGVGLFLAYDSTSALMRAEHPTIGRVEIAGVTFWFGWLMVAALVYSTVLPIIFGRLKMKPARLLHDKVLWADALMNKADWMTGAAAAVGVIGIGFGLWWADAVAAILIALDVLHDGYRHTTAAIRDLIDEVPRTVDDEELDHLPSQLQSLVKRFPWVQDCMAHVREEGRFLAGAIYVQPKSTSIDLSLTEDAERQVRDYHWRVRHVVIVPVPSLVNNPGRTG